MPQIRFIIYDPDTHITWSSAEQNRIRFRVKASVTRRPPHRSGREDFPHPVPRFRSFLPNRQPAKRHPDWRTIMLPADCTQFHNTKSNQLSASHSVEVSLYGLRPQCASRSSPQNGTLYPASPYLQRVVWATLPRLPNRIT